MLNSDIKWNHGTIIIRNTKTGNDREIPFHKEIGMLLEGYVFYCRPNRQKKAFFQRRLPGNEYIPMSSSSVRSVIRFAFRKAGITGWWKGTHALRRTAVSRIYNDGNGLKLTADILGHQSLDSTVQYVKVDFDSIKQAACPWSGGEIFED